MSRAYLAISSIFFVNGVFLASWVSRIPTVAQHLDLNNAQVGLALLGVAVGSLSAFPLVGNFISRFGSARVTLVCGLACCLALVLPAWVPSLLTLFLALILFGASIGSMDVAMNAQGIEIERLEKRTIMNSLHGFFSLGGFAGAALGGLIVSWGTGLATHFLAVALISAALLFFMHRLLLPDTSSKEKEKAPVFMLPPRALWGLGAIAFCSSIGEGSMADWSALYLNKSLGTTVSVAATGYAVFSLAMLAGRFSGDHLVARFGTANVVRTGGAIAALGLALGLLFHTLSTGLIGFGMVGLGLSVVVPSVFSAAGKHPTIPSGTAIAAAATMGYSGFLAGPPVLGWIAELSSLRLALVVVVILCAMIVLLSPAVKRVTA
ncbi:MAG: MFS transporter [Trueperaceae bacterium]|nr:MFS transporter [Trueperaceae bacterium]